ncbi:MAG: hypothetical protein ACK4MF_00805, partial [Hyphomicrobiaceae bacterium]
MVAGSRSPLRLVYRRVADRRFACAPLDRGIGRLTGSMVARPRCENWGGGFHMRHFVGAVVIVGAIHGASPASAACTTNVAGTTTTCEGANTGFSSVNRVSELHIRNLTGDVTRASGQDTFFIQAGGRVGVNAATGAHTIRAHDADALSAVSRARVDFVFSGNAETTGTLASAIKILGHGDVFINVRGTLATLGLDRSPGLVAVSNTRVHLTSTANVSTASVNGDAFKLVGATGIT